MEMVNFLYLVPETAWGVAVSAAALREAVEILLHMLSPFAPHMCEELWERIGGKGLLCTRSWPVPDLDVAREDEVEVVVQINGKVRSKLTVAAGAEEGEVRERVMADPKIREYTAGREVRKTVYVPGKLYSIVVS
jgi:leucyl-tRNA synthetase